MLLRAEVDVIKNGKFVAGMMVLDEMMSLVATGQCMDLIIPSAQTRVQGDKRTSECAMMFK